MLVVVVVRFFFLAGGPGGGVPTGRTTLLLLPATSPGPEPFGPDVAVGPRPTKASTALLSALPKRGPRGDQVGLYGGVRGRSSCNVQQLATYFAQNPGPGQAWADAENISYNDVPAFLTRLTPALLRVDARLTSYSYDGRPAPQQAVLETGTAVLVDPLGIPRARCNGGNPLAPALATRSRPVYSGERWSGFNQKDLFFVALAPQPLTKLVLIDVTTNKPFVRPLETEGRADADYSGATSPTPSTTASPRTRTPTTARK